MAAVADLSIFAVWFVAFALSLLALALAEAITKSVDVSIAGYHPFHGLAVKLHNALVEPLQDAVSSSSSGMARAWNAMLASLELLGALTILLGVGVGKALAYLWNHSLPAEVLRRVQHEIAKLKLPHLNVSAITAEVTRAVEAKFAATVALIHSEAGKAAHDAKAAAESAAKAAAKAEHAIVQNIENIVNNPVSYVTTTVERDVSGLASALTAVGGELAEIPGVAIPDLRDILGKLDLRGIGGLLPAIVLLRAIVNTLARETGLENAECRGKVKQICATDPNAWTSLLEGLIAIGFAFSLEELVRVAEPLVADLAPIIRKAA